MMRLFLVLLVALAPARLPAQAKFDPARLLVEFGAFCQMRSVDEMPAPDTHGAKIELLPEAPQIQWPTHVVPAMPGVSFGVRTEAPTAQVYYPVLIELTHPPFTISGVTRQSYITELGGQDASINAYSFDLFEEMVHGIWTFRAYHNGELLYEVAFDVVDPALAPGIGRDCKGDFLS